jgi:nucleoside-diphosphate-sugar epimerase
MSSQVLVTGAAGFIGSLVCAHLRQGKPFQGIEVRKNLPPAWPALGKNLRLPAEASR